MTTTNDSSDYNPATSSTNVSGQPSYDWNDLAGGTSNPTYAGDVPFQHAGGTTAATTNAGNGWKWVALTDAQKANTDTGFAGGTKEDDNCAPVIGSSAPNKDDLKRAYVAATTLTAGARSGHTILNLAWVRIPQNTTSPSAHIAFEFNQGTSACVAGQSGGLVSRQAGDMLVLYDFTGGATIPTITIDRWVTSGPCDVSSHSSTDPINGGCWGPGTTLSGTVAEANVDTGLNHVCDTHSSPTPSGTFCDPGEADTSDGTTNLGSKYVLPFRSLDHLAPSTDDTLQASEFGEAGIDLTAALIFTSASCVSFGQVNAISRTSGDSGTAAMEDLVGPGKFSLSNCTTGATTAMKKSSDNTTFTSMSNGDSLSTGIYVRDTATVTASPVTTWAGNVDFYLCFNSSTALTGCDTTSGSGNTNPTGTTVTQIGGDVAVCNTGGTCSPSNGPTATSSSTQLSAAGNYCWAALFTGTSPTGLPNAIATTTECFTATSPTSIATNPWFYPQDRVVISNSSGGNLAGSVAFKLFKSTTSGGTTTSAADNCAANGNTVGSGGLVYKESGLNSDTVSGSSPQTVDTSNSSFRITASTGTDLVWRVTYTSTNTSQTNGSSVCVEANGATITADGSVTFP